MTKMKTNKLKRVVKQQPQAAKYHLLLPPLLKRKRRKSEMKVRSSFKYISFKKAYTH